MRAGYGRFGAVSVAAVIIAATSQAAIRAQSDFAFLRMLQGNGPSVLIGVPGEFSFFMWLRRSSSGVEPMFVLEVPGAFDLLVDPQDQSLKSHRGGTNGPPLELVLPLRDGSEQVPVGEWILIGISWEGSTGHFQGWARSESVERVEDSVLAPGFTPSLPQGNLSLGWPQRAGTVAQQGVYGLIVFRNHAIDSNDFDDVWDQRDYFGGYRIANVLDGGNLNGPDSVDWMVNHAILTNPSEAVSGIPASAALPGADVVADNYCVFNAVDLDSTLLTAGNIGDLASPPDSFQYLSPFDAGESPFLVRMTPQLQARLEPTYVTGVAPKIRQIAFGSPQGLLRCVVSANSRATKTSDADNQTWPENYAHGFIQVHLAQVAGTLNRLPRVNGGSRWFGFDALSAPRTTGLVLRVSQIGAQRSFARLWSNSVNWIAGPGEGLWMDENSVYELKAQPEPGSLLVVDAPMVVRTYLLRYPGAGTLSWRPVKAAAQQLTGTYCAASSVDLNSPGSLTRVIGPDDVVDPANSRLVLDGDLTAQVTSGDAVYISAGAGQRGIAVISNLSSDDMTTQVTFEHWFEVSPAIGSTMHIGPWEIATIEYEWPALSVSDPEQWRGLELTAIGGSLVNFAWDVWRPDVNGLVFGVAGWGGRGYTAQLEEAVAPATPAWMQALQPDVWLQGIAGQESKPDAMFDYLSEIRLALPDAEVAWIGEGAHNGATAEEWHVYILDQAASAGVVATTMVKDQTIGTFVDQSVDGLRADGAHMSHRGNTRLAEGWTQQLRRAALPSPDIDGDGTVGIADLLLLLGLWGPCPALPDLCPADLDGDGVVGIVDFLLLLGLWGVSA